jgi:hypothetical protein
VLYCNKRKLDEINSIFSLSLFLKVKVNMWMHMKGQKFVSECKNREIVVKYYLPAAEKVLKKLRLFKQL